IVEFNLPPLREHRDDVPYLTAAFVKEFSNRFSKVLVGVSPGAERLLRNAPWPGNVRQLRNILERSCMASEGRILTERDVLAALGGTEPAASGAILPDTRSVPEVAAAVTAIGRDQIEQALQEVGGNRSAAERGLGL